MGKGEYKLMFLSLPQMDDEFNTMTQHCQQFFQGRLIKPILYQRNSFIFDIIYWPVLSYGTLSQKIFNKKLRNAYLLFSKQVVIMNEELNLILMMANLNFLMNVTKIKLTKILIFHSLESQIQPNGYLQPINQPLVDKGHCQLIFSS